MAEDQGTGAVAILTGDMISSSSLSRELRSHLPDMLRTAGDRVREHFGDAGAYPIDVFRGDSWQLALTHAPAALRVSLYLQGLLRLMSTTERLASRIAIGIGPVDFLPEESVSEGDGTAFRLSGRALEEMDRDRRLAIGVDDATTICECRALPTIVTLIDAMTENWTAKQALAATGALRDLTQEEIGREWQPAPVTQQAIAQHLDSAGWSAVREAVVYFEKIVRQSSEAGGSP